MRTGILDCLAFPTSPQPRAVSGTPSVHENYLLTKEVYLDSPVMLTMSYTVTAKAPTSVAYRPMLDCASAQAFQYLP